MSDDRLFGTVGAEHLRNDPYDVWDEWWSYQEDGTNPHLTVEEWTTRPQGEQLPSASDLLEAISYACEVSETDEGWHESLSDALSDPGVVALAGLLLDAVAERITYRMAGELVATHVIEIVDGELLYNGNPLAAPC